MGETFLKLLIQKEVIETQATASQLKENMNNLEQYIATLKSNINTSNEHVKLDVEGLKARGKRNDYTTTNLFKVYQFEPAKNFVRYVKTKKDYYENREDITSEKIMTAGINNYEALLTSRKWNTMLP